MSPERYAEVCRKVKAKKKSCPWGLHFTLCKSTLKVEYFNKCMYVMMSLPSPHTPNVNNMNR